MIGRFIFARFRFAAVVAAGGLFALEGSPQVAAQMSNQVANQVLSQESGAAADRRATPVTRQEVWQAVTAELRQRGLAGQQLPQVEDLDLPVALPALAGRSLRVASACWDRALRRAQFRVECGQPGQCLPFLAYVHDDLHNHIRDSRYVDACAQPGSRRMGSAGPRPAPEAAPKPTMRPGEPAIAVFLSSGMRMTASVTCLDRGGTGEVVRVRGLDGHIFRARISGPALLEALPQKLVQ